MNLGHRETQNLVGWLHSIPHYGSADPLKGVSIDSRTIRPGELFIALKGPRYDGHRFLKDAYMKGARGAVVEMPEHLPHFPQFHVVDTHDALYSLACCVQQQARYKSIAITGSAGKTSLREMMVRILSSHYSVLSPVKNFNNLIGVPMTLLNAQATYSYAVLELGSNAPGEIEKLGKLVRADIGILSNIGMAHLAGLGSLEGVRKEKYALWNTLKSGSIAIYMADMAAPARWKWPAHVAQRWSFSSRNPTADYFVQSCKSGSLNRQQIKLRTPEGSIEFTLPVPGEHQALNAAAATAAGIAAGCSKEEIVHQLAAFTPPNGRGNQRLLNQRHTWIDESYNANELSVQAAIDLLSDIPQYTILVLGTLDELGHFEEEVLHRLGNYTRTKSVDLVLGVGMRLQPFVRAAQAVWMPSLEAAANFLAQVLNRYEKTTTLVKGSRIAGLEHLFSLVQAAL